MKKRELNRGEFKILPYLTLNLIQSWMTIYWLIEMKLEIVLF